MERFYEGYLYDTENSELITRYETDLPTDDGEYYTEELRKAPNGKYFLHGEGNMLSPYSYTPYEEDEFQFYESGEDLIPLTFEEAKKCYEKKLDICYRYMSIKNAKDPAPNYQTYCQLFGGKEADK